MNFLSREIPRQDAMHAFAGHDYEVSDFDASLQLYDHGHIQTAFHARLFKTGELCIPGRTPEYVCIRFVDFRFNVVQDRPDAVYSVLRNGERTGEFFASAFRHLWL